MITATCKTDNCRQNGVAYNFGGHPSRVECGACHADCELSDLRDDPPMPDDEEPS